MQHPLCTRIWFIFMVSIFHFFFFLKFYFEMKMYRYIPESWQQLMYPSHSNCILTHCPFLICCVFTLLPEFLLPENKIESKFFMAYMHFVSFYFFFFLPDHMRCVFNAKHKKTRMIIAYGKSKIHLWVYTECTYTLSFDIFLYRKCKIQVWNNNIFFFSSLLCLLCTLKCSTKTVALNA